MHTWIKTNWLIELRNKEKKGINKKIQACWGSDLLAWSVGFMNFPLFVDVVDRFPMMKAFQFLPVYSANIYN